MKWLIILHFLLDSFMTESRDPQPASTSTAERPPSPRADHETDCFEAFFEEFTNYLLADAREAERQTDQV